MNSSKRAVERWQDILGKETPEDAKAMLDLLASTGADAEERALFYRDLLLSFVASLTLAENIGDVCDDVVDVMRRLKPAGYELPDSDYAGLDDVADFLQRRGVRTLHGVDLGVKR